MIAIIEFGFEEGEADFSIKPGYLVNLNKDQMDRLRAMIVVGIGVAENMWRNERERKYPPSENEHV